MATRPLGTLTPRSRLDPAENWPQMNVGFVSLSEALDLTTPSGRALTGMLAVLADYAKRAIMQSHSAKVALWLAC